MRPVAPNVLWPRIFSAAPVESETVGRVIIKEPVSVIEPKTTVRVDGWSIRFTEGDVVRKFPRMMLEEKVAGEEIDS